MNIDGACHCGNITWKAVANPDMVAICYCTDCQTFGSSAFQYTQIINNEYPRNINSIFADSISITASIGSRMKNDGVFSFQAHSEGIIKTILVDLNNNSSLRGYISINNFENIENLPFEKLISNGTLALNIKEGKFSKNYQGLVEIKGKSIKDAIDTYFNSSEQVKSFFKLFNIS